MNGYKLQEAGMAKAIRQHLLTADNAREQLFHMLDLATAEPYRAAARKMQALVRARDRTNTAAAADMFEFYAQYGWEHLVPAGDKMPWYKASSLDLHAAVAAVAILVLAAVVLVLRRLVQAVLGTAGRAIGSGRRKVVYDIKAKSA
jgi:ABC-type branched-subunit amino acid transport system permease subunit